MWKVRCVKEQSSKSGAHLALDHASYIGLLRMNVRQNKKPLLVARSLLLPREDFFISDHWG